LLQLCRLLSSLLSLLLQLLQHGADDCWLCCRVPCTPLKQLHPHIRWGACRGLQERARTASTGQPVGDVPALNCKGLQILTTQRAGAARSARSALAPEPIHQLLGVLGGACGGSVQAGQIRT
jgi:hypothetical protein